MFKKDCKLCGSKKSTLERVFKEKPSYENDYYINKKDYYREIRHCKNCDVFYNAYDSSLLPDNFYSGVYNESIEFGNLQQRFNKIINMPYQKSDNKQRVERIRKYLDSKANPSLYSFLDIGSGTGVFLYELTKYYDKVSCVDPDSLSISLIKQNIKVNNAWIGSVNNIPYEFNFDFISYNKVLEHIKDPISILKKSKGFLKNSGVFYIELPFAKKNSNVETRAEFAVEHHAIYTKKSLEYLINKADLFADIIKTINEPSGKNTIYAFARKKC